jgi:hypothetical protein
MSAGSAAYTRVREPGFGAPGRSRTPWRPRRGARHTPRRVLRAGRPRDCVATTSCTADYYKGRATDIAVAILDLHHPSGLPSADPGNDRARRVRIAKQRSATEHGSVGSVVPLELGSLLDEQGDGSRLRRTWLRRPRCGAEWSCASGWRGEDRGQAAGLTRSADVTTEALYVSISDCRAHCHRRRQV